MNIGSLNVMLGVNTAGLTRGAQNMKRFEQQVIGSNKRIQASFMNLGSSMALAGTMMVQYITVPLALIGAAATKAFGDFEYELAKVTGLVGVSSDQVREWGDEILNMAEGVGQTPKKLAETLYYVTSAGLRGSESMDVLQYSALAASAGLGNAQTAADALTSAINAYGTSAMSASQASDILIAGIREAKTVPEQFASAIGKIFPVAAQLGVGFQDIAAGLAAMTRTGTKSNEAATYMRRMLFSLIQEPPKAAAALRKLGLSFEGLRNTLATKGLLPMLMELKRTLGDDIASYGDVFPNIRALVGVLDILGPNLENNAHLFEAMGASAGSFNQAIAAVADTTKFQWMKATASISASFVKLGDTLKVVIIPIIKGFSEWLGRLIDRFKALKPETQKQIVLFGAVAAAIGPLLIILGQLAFAITSIAKLMLGATLGSWIGLFAGLAVVIYAAMRNADEFTKIFDEMNANMEAKAAKRKQFDKPLKQVEDFAEEYKDLIDEISDFQIKYPDLEGSLQFGNALEFFRNDLIESQKAVDQLAENLDKIDFTQPGNGTPQDIYAKIQDEIGNMVQARIDIIDAYQEQRRIAFGNDKQQIREDIKYFQKLREKVQEAGAAMDDAFRFKAEHLDMFKKNNNVGKAMNEFFSAAVKTFGADLEEMLGKVFKGLKIPPVEIGVNIGNLEDVYRGVSSMDEAMQKLNDTAIMQGVKKAWEDLQDEQEKVNKNIDTYEQKLMNLFMGASTTGDQKLVEDAVDAFKKLMYVQESAAYGVTKYQKEYNAALKAFEQGASDDVEALLKLDQAAQNLQGAKDVAASVEKYERSFQKAAAAAGIALDPKLVHDAMVAWQNLSKAQADGEVQLESYFNAYEEAQTKLQAVSPNYDKYKEAMENLLKERDKLMKLEYGTDKWKAQLKVFGDAQKVFEGLKSEANQLLYALEQLQKAGLWHTTFTTKQMANFLTPTEQNNPLVPENPDKAGEDTPKGILDDVRKQIDGATQAAGEFGSGFDEAETRIDYIDAALKKLTTPEMIHLMDKEDIQRTKALQEELKKLKLVTTDVGKEMKGLYSDLTYVIQGLSRYMGENTQKFMQDFSNLMRVIKRVIDMFDRLGTLMKIQKAKDDLGLSSEKKSLITKVQELGVFKLLFGEKKKDQEQTEKSTKEINTYTSALEKTITQQNYFGKGIQGAYNLSNAQMNDFENKWNLKNGVTPNLPISMQADQLDKNALDLNQCPVMSDICSNMSDVANNFNVAQGALDMSTIEVPTLSVEDLQIPDLTLPDLNVPELNLGVPELKLDVPEITIPDVNVPAVNAAQTGGTDAATTGAMAIASIPEVPKMDYSSLIDESNNYTDSMNTEISTIKDLSSQVDSQLASYNTLSGVKQEQTTITENLNSVLGTESDVSQMVASSKQVEAVATELSTTANDANATSSQTSAIASQQDATASNIDAGAKTKEGVAGFFASVAKLPFPANVVAFAVIAALIGKFMSLISGTVSNVIGMANGGVVPSGYPNDTYPALLTSGETVVPPGQLDVALESAATDAVDQVTGNTATRTSTTGIGTLTTSSSSHTNSYLQSILNAIYDSNTKLDNIVYILGEIGASGSGSDSVTGSTKNFIKSGVDMVFSPLEKLGGFLGLASGGIIPSGYPNDSFPAMLTSGEAVIPLDRIPNVLGLDRQGQDIVNNFVTVTNNVDAGMQSMATNIAPNIDVIISASNEVLKQTASMMESMKNTISNVVTNNEVINTNAVTQIDNRTQMGMDKNYGKQQKVTLEIKGRSVEALVDMEQLIKGAY